MKKIILSLVACLMLQAQATNYLKIRNSYKKPIYIYMLSTEGNKSIQLAPQQTTGILGSIEKITALAIKTDASLKEHSLNKELTLLKRDSASKNNDLALLSIEGTTFSWKIQIKWEANINNSQIPQRPAKNLTIQIITSLKDALSQNKYAQVKQILQRNVQLFNALGMNIENFMNPMKRDDAIEYLDYKLSDLQEH
jgi:hypothetical protein